MSMTGLDAFDATVHKTNSWLNAIMEQLDSDSRREAYHALRVVLHALRDRLTPEEAIHFGAQLPMLVRGFYYEGWSMSGKPMKATKEEFLRCVERESRYPDSADAERLARAVFQVIADHVTEGEIRDVKGLLPKGIRLLWPRSWWD